MSILSRSFVKRLAGSFLFLVLLELFIGGVIAFWGTRRALLSSTADRLKAISVVKEAEIHHWLETRIAIMEAGARAPGIEQAVSVLLEEEESSSRHEAALRLLEQIFEPWTRGNALHSEVLILAVENSQILYSSEREHINDYRPNDRYFLLGQQGTHLENVYLSPVTFRPTITISLPLRDADGDVRAVFAAHANLHMLDDILQEKTGLGHTGNTYAVDSLNVLVSAKRIGQEQYPRGLHSRGIDAALRGEEGIELYEDYTGVPVVGHYRWLADLELALIAEISQDEAFAPARRLGLIYAMFVVALGVLSLAAIVVLSRRIARPILSIAELASKVAAGDLTVRATVFADDETGTLARSFNQMIAVLQGYQEHLESLVEERTEQLKTAQTELVRQERLAVLGRITATVSHELRNPLGTVSNTLFLIREAARSGNEENLFNALAMAERNVQRCDRIINELLDYSSAPKEQRGELEIDPWLEELLDELKLPEDVRCERDLGCRLSLSCDPEQMRRAVINLINNAVQAVEEQQAFEKRIRVETEATSDALEIRVLDWGPGIAPEDRKHLFEPLFSTKNFGVGLGLPIVQDILNTLGGAVILDNRDSKGVVAVLHIPIH